MHLLITGAAAGIGAATVQAALDAGHQVMAADQDGEGLATRWTDHPQVTQHHLDVRDAAQWASLFESAQQPVDVLINIAGVLRPGHTGALEPADVALQIDVNVKGVILGTDAAARHMTPRGAGHIINLGSTACLYPTPGNTVYAASKYAVRGFTLAAAGDLKPHGIAVSLVGPSAVRTAMLEQQRGRKESALTFSGKRALTPEEVAQELIGPVLDKRPLEVFLPRSEGVIGKLATTAPNFFLKQAEKFRAKGLENAQRTDF